MSNSWDARTLFVVRCSRGVMGLAGRCFFAAALLTALQVAPAVQAYTPESPEVKQMVAAGYRFLETCQHEEEIGGDCLVALTLVKDGKNERHPIVARAAKRAAEAARAGVVADRTSQAMYSTGLAAIFLTELDAQKYQAEINSILAYIAKRQQTAGGFSYPTYSSGDTSQTQYCVLAMWTASKAGLAVNQGVVERTCNWLLRTQDPAGGWGYQGNDPGQPGARLNQNEVTQSLSSAGLGSVYVCADLLGFTAAPEAAQSGLPPAIKLVPKPGKNKQERGPKSTAVSQDLIRRSMSDGNRWFSQNLRIQNLAAWHFYFMYAFERYMSFREAAENRDEKEPQWYSQGVELLMTQQNADGSFGKSHPHGPYVDTAFAVLFLTRSTKKAIAKSVAGDGSLTGGKGLKGNMASARVKDGKIIAEPAKGTVDDLVSVLEDPRNPDVDALAEFPEAWINEVSPAKLAPHVDRLRRLVLAEKFEVRMVAVRALGRMSDFENVPHLIYALTDPDMRVVRLANEALRATTRKFVGFQLPPNANEQDRDVLVKKWKDWYRGVNPTAVFLD